MAQLSHDAVDLLLHQHRSIEALLDKVKKEDDEQKRKALYEQAADELTVHIKSEEDIFYPAVNGSRTEDDLREELEEHLSLKRLMADLMVLDDGDDKTFEAKVKVLKEQAEHHHKEEEEHLFPAVRKMFDQPTLEKLGKEMLELQNRLRQEGEPRDTVIDETDAAAPLPKPR